MEQRPRHRQHRRVGVPGASLEAATRQLSAAGSDACTSKRTATDAGSEPAVDHPHRQRTVHTSDSRSTSALAARCTPVKSTLSRSNRTNTATASSCTVTLLAETATPRSLKPNASRLKRHKGLLHVRLTF